MRKDFKRGYGFVDQEHGLTPKLWLSSIDLSSATLGQQDPQPVTTTN
ncbi:unnamed protein product [Acidithrix sp. C25]|nr:unnamed protein product [Acidithrix sp. C25]